MCSSKSEFSDSLVQGLVKVTRVAYYTFGVRLRIYEICVQAKRTKTTDAVCVYLIFREAETHCAREDDSLIDDN